MRIISSYLSSSIKYQLQYRSSSFFGALTQFIWGLLLIQLYLAFYASNPAAFPMSFPSLVAYIWLQQAFFSMVNLWSWDQNIFNSIQNGQVAYELLRPKNLYLLWFSSSFGRRVSKIVLRAPLILFASLILPQPYRLVFPERLDLLLLFFVSLVLGAVLCTTLTMLVYLGSFFLLDSFGIRILYQVTGEFLMGGVIPLPFFPDAWQRVINLLPFASVSNTPYLIYAGGSVDDTTLAKVALQVFWVGATLLAGKVLEKRIVATAVIQGG